MMAVQLRGIAKRLSTSFTGTSDRLLSMKFDGIRGHQLNLNE
jgi:hypothetical protein